MKYGCTMRGYKNIYPPLCNNMLIITAPQRKNLCWELKIVSRAFENSMIDFVYLREIKGPGVHARRTQRPGNYEIVINGE